MAYEVERAAFQRLKARAPLNARKQYIAALKGLHCRLDTADNSQRFVFGEAVERYTAALFCAAGITARPIGGYGNPADIRLVRSGARLSVKSRSTSDRGAEINLINKRGTGVRPWELATIFVFAPLGIVYADPDLVEASLIAADAEFDATKVKRSAIEKAAGPEYTMKLDIPEKPSSSKPRKVNLVDDLAMAVLEEDGLDRLQEWTARALKR